MAQALAAPHKRGFLSTLRTDSWWLDTVLMGIGLIVLFGWLAVSIFLDQWAFEIGPYVSPVFEPKLFEANDSIFISPALIVLLGPVPFRATCYYFRRAYYRSWFLSPPACAVGDVGKTYRGEQVLPFWLSNLHRFAMYIAVIFVPIVWWGAIRSFYNTHDAGVIEQGWGIGLGSILFVIDAFFLTMYTFSCHSLRHWIGGGLNCFSCSKWRQTRKRAWDYITVWNVSHHFWAWSSLIIIVLVDIYVRLVANGIITDPNTWSGF